VPTYFGGTGTTSFVIAANFTYFFKATANASGSATDARVYYNSGAGNMKLAVYADSSGAPGAKLGETSAFDVASGGVGWRNTTFGTPFAITSGTPYWLAWLCDNSPSMGNDTGPDNFRFVAATYPTFPGTGSGSTASTTDRAGFEIGVTVAAGITVPNIPSGTNLYTPTLTSATLTVPFIASTTTVYTTAVAFPVTVPHIGIITNVYTPTLATGAAPITAPFISSTTTLYTVTLFQAGTGFFVPHIASSSTVSAPSIARAGIGEQPLGVSIALEDTVLQNAPVWTRMDV
jgi:hypothetical protein